MGKTIQIATVVRYILGIVFLLAALYRIFNPQLAVSEMTALHVPLVTTWVVVILELAISAALLFNKYVSLACYGIFLFLGIAILIAFISSGAAIILTLSELFVFNATPTDILLHIMFIVLAVVLLAGQKR